MSGPDRMDVTAGRSRVLVLSGPATTPLIEGLAQDGESVATADTLAELEGFWVVVIDLSDGPASAAKRSSGRNSRGSSTTGRPDGGPFVLAITTSGAVPADLPLPADACVPAKDTQRALREVRGALAVRRLAEVMTELERLRSAVQHARRTAHDLAQPLTTIMARAQLLAGKLKPEDPHARPVGIICEESEKLARLIEEFQKLRVLAETAGSRSE